MTATKAQQRWQTGALEYVNQTNAFVERGLRWGWDEAGDEPKCNGQLKGLLPKAPRPL